MANGAGEKKTVTVDVERFVHTRNAVSFTQITTNLRHQHLTPPPPPQFAPARMTKRIAVAASTITATSHSAPKQHLTCIATRNLQSRLLLPKHD
jgi:hypothetical protein